MDCAGRRIGVADEERHRRKRNGAEHRRDLGPPHAEQVRQADGEQSRAEEEGDLPDGVDARALARFVMALSEGHAVHAAAGASP